MSSVSSGSDVGALSSSLLTEREVAAILRVAPSTVLRLVRDGRFEVEPIYVTPSVRRYRRSDIEKLVAAR